MQAQTTRTFGRIQLIGIGLIAVTLLAIATVSNSIELPSLDSGSVAIEPRVETSSTAPNYVFREANLYHPGFEPRRAVRPAEETRFIEMNTILHPDATRSRGITPNQPS